MLLLGDARRSGVGVADCARQKTMRIRGQADPSHWSPSWLMRLTAGYFGGPRSVYNHGRMGIQIQIRRCLNQRPDRIGMGNYWRISHEYLLLGVRGSLKFQDRCQPRWISASRHGHSRKPGIFRPLVERVSPGPYLELFGREEVPAGNWTVFGDEVGRRYW